MKGIPYLLDFRQDVQFNSDFSRQLLSIIQIYLLIIMLNIN